MKRSWFLLLMLPVALMVALPALHGGDEYELLFTARADRRVPAKIAGVPIARIGEIVRGRNMKLVTPEQKSRILKPAGWEHFG